MNLCKLLRCKTLLLTGVLVPGFFWHKQGPKFSGWAPRWPVFRLDSAFARGGADMWFYRRFENVGHSCSVGVCNDTRLRPCPGNGLLCGSPRSGPAQNVLPSGDALTDESGIRADAELSDALPISSISRSFGPRHGRSRALLIGAAYKPRGTWVPHQTLSPSGQPGEGVNKLNRGEKTCEAW